MSTISLFKTENILYNNLVSGFQRALDDDDIVLGLKLYEAKMTGMQRQIAQQLAIIKKQKSRIEDIKYYLRRKGDDYEKEDLEGLIIADTEKAKQNLQLVSLDNLVREVDHHWKRQRVSDRCHLSWPTHALALFCLSGRNNKIENLVWFLMSGGKY